jgi:hypothetical protein
MDSQGKNAGVYGWNFNAYRLKPHHGLTAGGDVDGGFQFCSKSTLRGILVVDNPKPRTRQNLDVHVTRVADPHREYRLLKVIDLTGFKGPGNDDERLREHLFADHAEVLCGGGYRGRAALMWPIAGCSRSFAGGALMIFGSCLGWVSV